MLGCSLTRAASTEINNLCSCRTPVPLAVALRSFLQCQEQTQMLSARCDKSQMTGALTKTFPGQLCETQQLCTQTPAVQWYRGDGDPNISYARGGINTPRPPLPLCPQRKSLSSCGLRPWLQEAAQTHLCEICPQLPILTFSG